MARPLKIAPNPICYPVADVPDAIGYGETVVKKMLAAGAVEQHFNPHAPTKGVILHDDLVALVKSWPTERPGA